MKTTDPIIITELLWTKELIFGQLDRNGEEVTDFTSEDISDEDAEWFVREENSICYELLSEEDFVESMIELNEEFVLRVRG